MRGAGKPFPAVYRQLGNLRPDVAEGFQETPEGTAGRDPEMDPFGQDLYHPVRNQDADGAFH